MRRHSWEEKKSIEFRMTVVVIALKILNILGGKKARNWNRVPQVRSAVNNVGTVLFYVWFTVFVISYMNYIISKSWMCLVYCFVFVLMLSHVQLFIPLAFSPWKMRPRFEYHYYQFFDFLKISEGRWQRTASGR